MASDFEICWINHTFNASKGGKEILNWHLIHGLLERGHRIDLVTNKYEEVQHPNLRIHEVPMFGKSIGVHRWIFARFARRKASELSTDFVFSNGKTGFGEVVRLGSLPHQEYLRNIYDSANSRFTKFFKKIKKATNLSDRLALYLERVTFCSSDLKRLIVPSGMIKNKILEHFDCLGQEDVSVIYNGFDRKEYEGKTAKDNRNQIRRNYGIKQSDEVLLFVGHDFQRKGLDRAVNFLAGSREAHLLVVGRDDPIPVSRELSDQIHWVGEVDDVTVYYDASDVLILPSYSEGFGLVVLEAMSRGCYPVVSDTTGAGELLDDESLGLVLEEFSPGHYRKIDWEVVTSSADREARRGFAKQFDWSTMVDQYEALFQGLFF